MSSETICLILPMSIFLGLLAGGMLLYADYLFSQFRRFTRRDNFSPIAHAFGFPWTSPVQLWFLVFLFGFVVFLLSLMHWLIGMSLGVMTLFGFGASLLGEARQIDNYIAQIPPFKPKDRSLIPGIDAVFSVLIGRRGEYKGVEIECIPNMRIGRSKTNNLVLRQGSVSREHAKLKYANKVWYIQDCGSRMGIYINGRRELAKRLKHGDVIKIGSTEFEFRER